MFWLLLICNPANHSSQYRNQNCMLFWGKPPLSLRRMEWNLTAIARVPKLDKVDTQTQGAWAQKEVMMAMGKRRHASMRGSGQRGVGEWISVPIGIEFNSLYRHGQTGKLCNGSTLRGPGFDARLVHDFMSLSCDLNCIIQLDLMDHGTSIWRLTPQIEGECWNMGWSNLPGITGE
ncbi:uncharacterized protein EI90DRAFT_3023143 [Cantharellus anzutake]|uniref:uncharacterized protein n=1 Tax=Cantharellus anzutake TaxID=1750568 RepID=UPI001905496E|nr:uncharacterized protein EI90DRAFT_3023143 [Cantharellus anzutake]KAF8312174.1 hypothetical protein EI90DRAFT_3023143 [Cantharellus anzutake]